MNIQVGRWGNSLAVRIPKDIADRFNLSEGSELSDSALVQALEIERQMRRTEALERLAARKWKLPEGWRFDREEAHERGPL